MTLKGPPFYRTPPERLSGARGEVNSVEVSAMKKIMTGVIALVLICVGFLFINQAARGGAEMTIDTFDKIEKQAAVKEGVKEITYEQFRELRDSGEEYVLLDVLSPESYESGHIEDAESFFVATIDADSASQRLSKDSKIVVYCGGFRCAASSNAARKLSELGYNVIDYKGGLEEWKEKGNQLVK